jgi:hypothetical protein
VTEVPRYASGLPAHTSASELPSRPRMRSAIGSSAGLKPVPNTSVSISRSTPSPSTIECSRSSRTPELTRSTFGSWMAGYHLLEMMIRLQKIS